MKKIFLTIIFLLITVISFSFTEEALAACEFEQLYFKPAKLSNAYPPENTPQIKVNFKTKGCVGETVGISIINDENRSVPVQFDLGPNVPGDFTAKSGQLLFDIESEEMATSITFLPSEKGCKGGDCKFYLRKSVNGGGSYRTHKGDNAKLTFPCYANGSGGEACDDVGDDKNWRVVSVEEQDISDALCEVVDVKFNHSNSGVWDGPFPVDIEMSTRGCAGNKIYVSLIRAAEDLSGVERFQRAVNAVVSGGLSLIFTGGNNDKVVPAVNKGVITPQANSQKVTIKMEAGMDHCSVSRALDDGCTYILVSEDESGGDKKWVAGSGITYKCASRESCDVEPKWKYLDNNQSGVYGSEIEGSTLSAAFSGADPCEQDVANCYSMLAPLPFKTGQAQDEGGFSITNEGDTKVFRGRFHVGTYINLLIQILTGLLGVAAVVMIVVSGLGYMQSVSPPFKVRAKNNMLKALLGLLMSLSIFVILNTINPQLLDIDPNVRKVTVSEAEIFNEEPEVLNNRGRTDASYVMSGTYSNPIPSPGVAEFVSSTRAEEGFSKIVVRETGSDSRGEATFYTSTGYSVTVDVRGGQNGFADIGKAKVGDKKTPKGVYNPGVFSRMSGDAYRLSSSTNDAVLTNANVCVGAQGKKVRCNMGALYVLLDIESSSGKVRGIGFHGDRYNKLGKTAGCIKMKNEDLLALKDHFLHSGGAPLFIE